MFYKILLLILIILLSIIFKIFLKYNFNKKNYKYTEQFLNKQIVENFEEEENKEKKSDCENNVSNETNIAMTLANINSQYQQLSKKYNYLEEDVQHNQVQLEELNDQISQAQKLKNTSFDESQFNV